MKNTFSYPVKILHEYSIFHSTVSYYRDAVRYILPLSIKHFSEIRKMSSSKSCMYMEKLIHGTSKREARYPEFDIRFQNIPSYLMRSAICDANASAKSYMELIEQWKEEGCKEKKPKLNMNQDWWPDLYRGNMFDVISDDMIKIKIRNGKAWIWHLCYLSKQDVLYLKKHVSESPSVPKLIRMGHRYVLRFTYEKHSDLSENTERVCGVDLGLNTVATCSILNKNGTVTARTFINSAVEKDRMYRVLNGIRQKQQEGNRRMHKLWRFVDYYNRQISINTAAGIVDFAIANSADTIVFEHLDTTGKIKGSKKQRIKMWRHRDIQKRVEERAHRYGIRVSHICAWNTSALAYDGSGKVTRDSSNHSLCTFTTGRRYNCDLSASYNIGARFFVRSIIKSVSEKEQLEILAKVPECAKRTQCTLSTLISLHAVLEKVTIPVLSPDRMCGGEVCAA